MYTSKADTKAAQTEEVSKVVKVYKVAMLSGRIRGGRLYGPMMALEAHHLTGGRLVYLGQVSRTVYAPTVK